jgi:predicted subunit of tRNA(5-methylaminomethyl-2-thiouridylate) methyltransferase
MPNMVAKIARSAAGGIVATDGVRRENAQPRTSNAQLRSLEDRDMNPIGRARKSNARNIPRGAIEDLLNAAMIAGPARADRNNTRIIIPNPIVRPSQTNRSLRLR